MKSIKQSEQTEKIASDPELVGLRSNRQTIIKKKVFLTKSQILYLCIITTFFIAINLIIWQHRNPQYSFSFPFIGQSRIPQQQIDMVNNQQFHQQEDQQQQSKQKHKDKVEGSSIQSIIKHDKIFQVDWKKSEIAKKRVELGQPKRDSVKLSVLLIKSINEATSCIVINSLPILTKNVAENTLSIFEQVKVSKMLIYSNSFDTEGRNFTRMLFLGKGYDVIQQEITMDADYQFIIKYTAQCSVISYLNNQINLSKQHSRKLINQLVRFEPLSVAYTAFCTEQKQQEHIENQLRSLSDLNLGQITSEIISEYVFIFDSRFLSILTPLSFSFYVRYSLEQFIIVPLLAISQRSQKLKKIEKSIHLCVRSHPFLHTQIPIQTIKKQDRSMCFISLSASSHNINEEQFLKYISSIQKLQRKTIKLTVIIYAEYSDNSPLYPIAKKLIQFKYKSKQVRVKLRVVQRNSVSHAVYESTYLYCPESSIIVTSRHNVEFYPQFAKQIMDQVSQKYHYYQPAYFNKTQQASYIFQKVTRYERPYFVRSRIQNFQPYFKSVQVFKSGLMKSLVFWSLKSAQIDFYETQAVYFIQMMQLVRFNVKYIESELFSIQARSLSPLEIKQIKNLKKYVEYSELPAKRLSPFPHNCLDNQAYRKNAPDKIEKKVHQIWLGGAKVSKVRMKLHQTILKTNPSFQVLLWKDENITKQRFPLTFNIIKKALQYQKSSSRSYYALVADLLRYQILYNEGGIYLDFKMEVVKPLNPFLKYQIFFIDGGVDSTRFPTPVAVGVGIIGSMSNGYYFKILLNEVICQSKIDLQKQYIPAVTGGVVVRKIFNDEQIFKVVGFGYHLFIPKPSFGDINDCGKVKSFSPDQEVVQMIDSKTSKTYRVGLPCKQYSEAYILSYKPLASSWKGSKRNMN